MKKKRDGYISTVSDNQHIKLHEYKIMINMTDLLQAQRL